MCFEGHGLGHTLRQVALEVMSYHARASEDECAKFLQTQPPTCVELQLDDFGLNTNAFNEDLSIRSCLRMFMDFGASLTSHCRI